MPRLVLHGMQTTQAVQVREQLFKALKTLELDTETVVEILPSRVMDSMGKDRPFLEVISTERPEADLMVGDIEVRAICVTFGLDIEISEAADRYIPREQLKVVGEGRRN